MTRGFVRFVHDHVDELLRFAWMLTGDRQEAEDLVQETLLRAHARWPRVRAAAMPSAYAKRILLNCHIDRVRRYTPRMVELTADRSPSAPDVADFVVDRDTVRRMLQTLPPQQRTIVVLRYYEGVSVHEISETLHIGESSVRSAISRAMSSLRCLVLDDEVGRPQ